MSGLKICLNKKKKQPTINLQHSLISSKSIFFATSPFHSLQVTQRVLEHLSTGAGKQGTDHLAWAGGAPFEGKELGLHAAPPDEHPFLLGSAKSWWEGGFHAFHREVMINSRCGSATKHI